MPCSVHFFPVSAVQKLLKSVKIWRTCSHMYTATFYEPLQKCRFWFFQVRCTHKSGDVINFIIVACRISSRLKWYKNCKKNRLRLAKVIVKNKISRFLWFTVYIWEVGDWTATSDCDVSSHFVSSLLHNRRCCDIWYGQWWALVAKK